MSSTAVRRSPALVEIEKELEKKNEEIVWDKLSHWGKVKEAILMVTQKAASPSVTTSPAIIALALSLILQTVAVVWWAAGVSKDNEANAREIKELKSDISTQKVYIDTTREKFIKMEAIVDSMQNQKQIELLLKQQKDAGK